MLLLNIQQRGYRGLTSQALWPAFLGYQPKVLPTCMITYFEWHNIPKIKAQFFFIVLISRTLIWGLAQVTKVANILWMQLIYDCFWPQRMPAKGLQSTAFRYWKAFESVDRNTKIQNDRCYEGKVTFPSRIYCGLVSCMLACCFYANFSLRINIGTCLLHWLYFNLFFYLNQNYFFYNIFPI